MFILRLRGTIFATIYNTRTGPTTGRICLWHEQLPLMHPVSLPEYNRPFMKSFQRLSTLKFSMMFKELKNSTKIIHYTFFKPYSPSQHQAKVVLFYALLSFLEYSQPIYSMWYFQCWCKKSNCLCFCLPVGKSLGLEHETKKSSLV